MWVFPAFLGFLQVFTGFMLILFSNTFVGFSNVLDDLYGQIFALFILVVAAAEAAIGLAILIIFFNKSGTISVDFINKLKG